MPLYIVNVRHGGTSSTSREAFVKALANLHAKSFGTDPAAVRVEFVISPSENVFRYGGYGSSISKFLGIEKTSDYMVARIDFRGSMEGWQEYCREIMQLKLSLRSIYLQRLDFEFEVEDEKLPGKVVTKERNEAGEEALPSYKA